MAYIDYPYEIRNGELFITYPQGYTLKIKRVKNGADTKMISKQNHLLSGKLCTYSSSALGGYSHSDRVYFDGKGNFSTSSETYSRGNSGTYAGTNNGNSGRYSINANTIVIIYGDGSKYRGEIIERAPNGYITGINVNGNIFSSKLCD
jgi:hypothetical protein